ncbi:phosphatidylinositol transfer protein 1-like [Gossypium australe]|uniref:Phosphatidylinositol transfer protein 1-like n=1 Tax=Gossypium australe TaxID=47621 RepID=A0A5B6X7A7_9ROSI|nr:phosphatidylinositol transfer protein 1-like [Gossypium australe]
MTTLPRRLTIEENMVQVKEFRIVMPMSLEEYRVAQTFMVLKMQQQSTNEAEGVEVLENKGFEDDVYGKGQYTSKLYRLQSKAPSWLTTLAPKDALIMQEESWNAYPRCKTGVQRCLLFIARVHCISCINICHSSVVYKMDIIFLSDQDSFFEKRNIMCPYFAKLSVTIETIHLEDNGKSENVHGLNKEQLAARQVEFIDITMPTTDYWSYAVGNGNFDFSTFKSEKTGRGPLLEGWQENSNPVMTAYKLVTIKAPYWGFGGKLEQALLAGERALFVESHRNCFGWIDEWYGMTVEQLSELEEQGDCLLNQKISKPLLLTDTEDHESKFTGNSKTHLQQGVKT